MRFVNVYIEDRAYGGSEEGGWWYDTSDPVPVSEVVDAWPGKVPRGRTVCGIESASFRATPRRIERLKRWVERNNEGRRDIYSVLSEGRYALCIESHPPMPPQGRPVYE